MKLEQVKEIIHKPRRNAGDDDHGLSDMNQDKLSPDRLWVATQIPVQITIRNSSGDAEIYTARTIFFNRRGAKLECITPPERGVTQHPFKLHQMLWIEVPSTGRADGGEVIWADTRRNAEGNFEFAVELGDARNLFELSSPSRDCQKQEIPIQTTAPASLEIHQASVDSESEAVGQRTHERSATRTMHPDLTKERLAAIQSIRSAPRVSSSEDSDGAAAHTPTGTPAAAVTLPAQPHTPLGLHAVQDSRRQQPHDVKGESLPMTDRLAEVFREVISAAAQKEEETACARLVERITSQAEQIQLETLESLRNEITQDVSVLEEQLLQQCRSRTEHMITAVMKTALSSLSTQIDEMAERAQERIQGVLKDLGDQLEQRSASALAEANTHLQAQLEKSAVALHGSIVQKVLSEIDEKQKDMTEHVQKQIGIVTEQNLGKLRGGLIRALQELTTGDGNL
ncbi:MAG: hypothetical protein HYX72_05245 [Acidobacteria bacterium]|nr:hypothetical protein [Acidobacteriota bacterium]